MLPSLQNRDVYGCVCDREEGCVCVCVTDTGEQGRVHDTENRAGCDREQGCVCACVCDRDRE